MKTEKKFCKHCGRKLKAKVFVVYDEATGKRIELKDRAEWLSFWCRFFHQDPRDYGPGY